MAITYQIIGRQDFKQVGKNLIENGVEVKELGKLKTLFQDVYIPDNYHQLIKRVSVIGVRNFDLWFKGGELALTTPQNFPSIESQRELIDRMIRSRSACLVFHPGKHEDNKVKVFKETFSYAKLCNLPLLVLNPDIPYSEIIEIVFKLDMKKQNKNLNIFSSVNQELFQYLSNNATLKKTLQNIGRLTKSLYVVSDINLMPFVTSENSKTCSLANIVKSDTFQEFVNDENIINLLFNENKLSIKVDKDSEYIDVIAAPIKQGKHLKSVLFVQKQPDYFINKIINQLLNSLSLVKDQKAQSREKYLEQANNELFDKKNIEKANDLFEQVGLTLSNKNVLILLSLELPKNARKDKNYINYVKLRIQQYLEHDLNKGDFSACYNNTLIIFISSKDKNYHRRIVEKIDGIINQYFQGIGFYIGVSSSNTPYFHKLYKETLYAIQVGRQNESHITFFSEVGYSQAFIELEDDYYLKQYYLNTLHPLLVLESRKKEELLVTLEAFLDCNLNYTATAEYLYVHPNTIRYRIEQIKELFEDNNIFTDPDKRFNIYFALKTMNLLKDYE